PMFLDVRLGNTPRWFIEPPRDWRMNVPDVVLNNVVFIGVDYPGGGLEPGTWAGTAFFVSVPAPDPMGCQSGYLVTVRHIADKLAKRRWCIRINTKDGQSVLVEGSPDVQWWKHPTEEESVDCAVLPFIPDESLNADVSAVPVSMFATENVIEENG